MIDKKEAVALVKILGMAENHPMWTRGFYPQQYKDDMYEAITIVRQFLKKQGIQTPHALLEKLAKEGTKNDE